MRSSTTFFINAVDLRMKLSLARLAAPESMPSSAIMRSEDVSLLVLASRIRTLAVFW